MPSEGVTPAIGMARLRRKRFSVAMVTPGSPLNYLPGTRTQILVLTSSIQ